MSDDPAFWRTIQQVDAMVSIYDGPKQFQRQFAAAPPSAAHLFAAQWCHTEVCNGGFAQFYGNSPGVLAPEAVVAFGEIGMPGLAAVVAKANAWFGFVYPRHRPVRKLALKLLLATSFRSASPFETLDEEFFHLSGVENGGYDVAAQAYFLRRRVA